MDKNLSAHLRENYVKSGHGQCGDQRHATYAVVSVFCGPIFHHQQLSLFQPPSTLPPHEPKNEKPFIEISIRNSPNPETLKNYINENQGNFSEYQSGYACDLRLRVDPSDIKTIRELAEKYREVGKLHHSSIVSHWRYTCPRIAWSLEKLAEVIETFNKDSSIL
jgi:hypothetical protein